MIDPTGPREKVREGAGFLREFDAVKLRLRIR